MLSLQKKTILYPNICALNFVIHEGQFTIFDEKRGHFRGTKNDLLIQWREDEKGEGEFKKGGGQSVNWLINYFPSSPQSPLP